MKIVAINGSPNIQGSTSKLIDLLLEELEKQENETDNDFTKRILLDYPKKWHNFVNKVKNQVIDKIKLGHSFQDKSGNFTVEKIRKRCGRRMDRAGAHIRAEKDLKKAWGFNQ